MKTIELDGKLIKKQGHDYIKKKFNFPNYYGKNIDALYDCLTDIGVETEVRLSNKHLVPKDILLTFIDASEDNMYLIFKY